MCVCMYIWMYMPVLCVVCICVNTCIHAHTCACIMGVHMHVCMYTCECIYMHAVVCTCVLHVCACIYICTCVYVYVCLCDVCICEHGYMGVCVYVCVVYKCVTHAHVCAYAGMCVSVHACMYVHIQTHVDMCAYMSMGHMSAIQGPAVLCVRPCHRHGVHVQRPEEQTTGDMLHPAHAQGKQKLQPGWGAPPCFLSVDGRRRKHRLLSGLLGATFAAHPHPSPSPWC